MMPGPVYPTPAAAPLVLVVDDDEGARATMAQLLRAAGYRPLPASQGLEAVWMVERWAGQIELVVTELQPRAADGFHLGIPYDRLRPYTPVLFTARMSRSECVERGLLDRRAAYIRKPFPPSAFARRVRDVIAAWPALPAA